MLHGAFGAHGPGSAGLDLKHLLDRLAGATPAAPSPDFAARLGQWLGWTGAISLAAALAPAADRAGTDAAPSARDAAADVSQVRARLAASISAGLREPMAAADDFEPLRRHCTVQQQAMQEAVAALRQRLRQALAQRTPAGARLAAIDAALEQSLAATERSLLAGVTLRLQAQHGQLRRRAGQGPQWTHHFLQDMEHVLLAELEHRLLPAQGLLQTLLTPACP
jgi:hypothetical protein